MGTYFIKELWLQLSSLRGAKQDKPSEMMAFSFIVNELGDLHLFIYSLFLAKSKIAPINTPIAIPNPAPERMFPEIIP